MNVNDTITRKNPYSPPAYGGTSYPGVDYQPMDFSPVVPAVVLTANQALTDQSITIENDADFDWMAIIIPTFTGAFKIRFYDSQRFALSNDFINYRAFVQNNAPSYYIITPSILVPAGGAVYYDITDLSGAGNTIQIVLRGVKLWKLR